MPSSHRRPGMIRRVLAVIATLVAALLLISPTSVPPVAAAPARQHDEVVEAFLARLLDEINARRGALGHQRLAYVPPVAGAALDGFLAVAAPAMAWPGPCMHQIVGGAFSWDYVQAAGFGGEARGEVLACPGPEPYWTPGRAAEQWWESPIHFSVLYGDGEANAVACSAYGVQADGGVRRRGSVDRAASAILCVTFRG